MSPKTFLGAAFAVVLVATFAFSYRLMSATPKTEPATEQYASAGDCSSCPFCKPKAKACCPTETAPAAEKKACPCGEKCECCDACKTGGKCECADCKCCASCPGKATAAACPCGEKCECCDACKTGGKCECTDCKCCEKCPKTVAEKTAE